jgi:hypothetical protein
MSVRIGIITDIHHGPSTETKAGSSALGLLGQFADFIAEEQPDLILDMGDRISDVDAMTDLRHETQIAEFFGTLGAPTYHLCGNHDRDHLSVSDNEAILDQQLSSQVVDVGDWQIVLWRANAKMDFSDERYGFPLNDDDLPWLASTMRLATKPCLVVSHVPLSGHGQIGNYYFENQEAFSRYQADAAVRDALALCPHPVACIAGHVHWNTVTVVNGIYHFTQQSLTETFATQGQPASAWGMLELDETVNWQVFGRDPFAFSMTPTATRWMPPR